MNVHNKLGCLSHVSLYSLVKYLQVRLYPNPSARAPLLGRLLALPTNTRLGWKGLHGTNTLYILRRIVNYSRTKFYNIEPRC
jgi:hypothetical protein